MVSMPILMLKNCTAFQCSKTYIYVQRQHYTLYTSLISPRKTLKGSLFLCLYRHINSAKYDEKCSFRVPKIGRLVFMCLQCPSCLFVLYPLLLTNSFEWLTVSCWYPCFDKLEYDFQQSDIIRVPGSIHCLMMGSRVASVLSSTGTRKHFLVSSSISSEYPLALYSMPTVVLPLAHFTFVNLNSFPRTTNFLALL